jgi:hypothetical protein
MTTCHPAPIAARRSPWSDRLTIVLALASAGCDAYWTYRVPGVPSTLEDHGHRYYQVRGDERSILAQLSATVFAVTLYVDWEVTNLADEPLEVGSLVATVSDARGRALPLSSIEAPRLRCEGGSTIAKGAKCHGDVSLAPPSVALFGYGDLKTITLDVAGFSRHGAPLALRYVMQAQP